MTAFTEECAVAGKKGQQGRQFFLRRGLYSVESESDSPGAVAPGLSSREKKMRARDQSRFTERGATSRIAEPADASPIH